MKSGPTMQTSSASQLLKEANELHLAGNLTEAQRLYEQILQIDAKHARAAFGIGLLEFQAGRHEAALAIMQRAIELDPQEIRFHFGLGQVLAELKRYADAENAYQRVLASNPRQAEIQFAIGRLREMQEDYAGAVEAYGHALEIQPDFADALINFGNCSQRRGQLGEAESAYRRVLSLRPDSAAAMANLGIVLAASDRSDEAIDLLNAAIGIEPADVMYRVNLGAVLCRRRNFTEAVAILQQAIQLNPDLAAAAYNLGNALHGLGQLRDAVVQYRHAIELQPDYADAHNNLGTVYKELGEFSHAAAAFAGAMQLCPSSAVAFNNAANLHRMLGQLDEAERLLRQALTINPALSATHNNLGNVLKDAGELDEAIDCYRNAITLEPANAAAHGNLAYSLHFQETDGDKILEECCRWDARHGLPLRPIIHQTRRDKSSDRPLRIGYVSGDFREHCQSLFTIPLLSHHDHAVVEVFCYSSVERPDDRTRQIAHYADTWRDVRHLDDAELAAVIEKDRVDILVDLAMHMAGGRPGLFARKPASMQVAWLAYPGTTGISAIDYALTDPWLTPAGFENHYSETVVRLPETFWCYDPLANEPGVNELPALASGHITFGCLNAPCKITAHTLRLWSAVMQKIPSSRLLLMAPEGGGQKQLLARLAEHGISRQRLTMQSFLPRQAYLRSYHQIDLGLDTIPYNGHTTSLDSFWMGVPVVSRVGQTAVGRAGLSQLSNLGMSELAAETDEQFVEIAVNLATDLPRLATLRRQLRQRMRQSVLMDGRRFARNMEAAFGQMWRERRD